MVKPGPMAPFHALLIADIDLFILTPEQGARMRAASAGGARCNVIMRPTDPKSGVTGMGRAGRGFPGAAFLVPPKSLC